MALSKSQSNAVDVFKQFMLHPTQKELVIEGSPGTGKTYLTKELIKTARKLSQMQNLIGTKQGSIEVVATATTNKAAEVMTQALGEDAVTVHSAFGIRPRWNQSKKEFQLFKTAENIQHDHSLVIVDEVSGVDLTLQSMVRQSLSYCKTIKIGDPYQLTAVGSLYPCEFENCELKVVLDESQRFGDDTQIKHLNRQMEETIRTGVFKPIIADGTHIEYINGQQFQDLINIHFDLSLQGTNHAKIVCWGNPSVIQYNTYVRGLSINLEAPQVGEMLVSNDPIILSPTSKICISTEQIVIVTSVEEHIDSDGLEGWFLGLQGCQFKVFKPREMYKSKMVIAHYKKAGNYYKANALKDFYADLRPLHSSTAYKAQGSTYEVVFVDLDDIGKCHCWTTVARMLNVAFTRARTKVYLYGQLPYKYRNQIHALPNIEKIEKTTSPF